MTTINEFFNEDYITFASYDNNRKIPSICDGLKISQRKILYTILKNNIDSESKEIKVEQLSAKASEQTSYLHGANSLNGVIAGLATKFVGSNNVNILEPDGNFGTRFIKEASASRYIYTYLSPLAKYIFRKEDEPILDLQSFEGQLIEPKAYYPIVPLVLVNGTEGVSVGFSSNIAPRNILDIIKWLEYRLIHKPKNIKLLPYYKNFTGEVKEAEIKNKYIISGKFIRNNTSKITIIELPIKYNLKNYIKVLDSLCDKDIIKNYKDLSDNDKFNFEVNVKREFLANKSDDEILSELKLNENVTDNFVLLDSENKIKEYNNIYEILEEFYNIRLNIYKKRKDYQISELENEILINENKRKFIKYILDLKISIKDTISNLNKQLNNLNFLKINNNYDYLLNMSIYSLTKDKIILLEEKINNLTNERNILYNTTIEQIWLNELKELKNKLKEK